MFNRRFILQYSVYCFRCDVANRQAVLDLVQKVKTEVGNVTMLVNNAGIMPCHSLLDHTEGEIRKLFDINVFAHFWVSTGNIHKKSGIIFHRIIDKHMFMMMTIYVSHQNCSYYYNQRNI